MVTGILAPVGFPRPLGDPYFDLLYEEAQRLNAPLAIHGAPARGLGFDFFRSLIEARALSHPFAQMIHLTSIVLEGVLERFPKLRYRGQHRRLWPTGSNRDPEHFMRSPAERVWAVPRTYSKTTAWRRFRTVGDIITHRTPLLSSQSAEQMVGVRGFGEPISVRWPPFHPPLLPHRPGFFHLACAMLTLRMVLK